MPPSLRGGEAAEAIQAGGAANSVREAYRVAAPLLDCFARAPRGLAMTVKSPRFARARNDGECGLACARNDGESFPPAWRGGEAIRARAAPPAPCYLPRGNGTAAGPAASCR